MKKFLIVVLLLSSQLLAVEIFEKVWPQQYSLGAKEKADEFYNKGTRLTQKKEYKKAIYWLEESYKYNPKSDTILNLGFGYKYTHKYDKAIKYYKKAVDMGESLGAFDLALLYEEAKKDLPNAIKWYKKGVEMGHLDAAFNLALLYKNTKKDLPNAIKWYKKAISMGHLDAAYNLALLYKNTKKDLPNAIKWYKKAISMGHQDAVKNLSILYHNQNDDLTATAYVIARIPHGYSKEVVINFLKNKWKISDETLKKAYELQKKLVPNPYKGGL